MTWTYSTCENSLGEESTSISVRRHSQLLNLSERSVWRILHHDLHFHPYKLQIVQELTAAHKALRVSFCQQMVHTHADLQFTGPYCSKLFLWGYLKVQVFTHTLPDINSLKNAIREDCECYAGHSTSRHGKCTWEMAAMPWWSWRTSLRRCIEDVRFFLWIQDTDLLNHVQLYLLLCTKNVLSYFQNG